MTAIEADSRTLDAPTLWAAAFTLLFAVGAGVGLSALPQEGSLGGALDALKNLIYVLTVPVFDLSRRTFSRRKTSPLDAAAGGASPNLLGTAFVTALVLFVLIELVSWLTGFAMGGTCVTLGHTPQSGNFGQCLTLGIGVFGTFLVAPIMIALGISAGWIWKGTLHSGFWITLLIFAAVVAVLFALDFFILLQQPAGAAQAVQDNFNAIGPVRQVGLQVAILTTSVLLGYGARRLWHGIARLFG
ncbi:hypothetical protein [Hyphomicrobium sp. LHD-15]|uniref:hypothetical protein n=1 Tax=Hyphomicrobium sp. LHD-15 TaxID=3072142 RepID=UPI00280DE34E|nr:hypothetical protein [Hyphomicrobium sp. LHD-15]MDQ8697481.1 hypothetical protein [Hyphomicrobium sp. LHD-15]